MNSIQTVSSDAYFAEHGVIKLQNINPHLKKILFVAKFLFACYWLLHRHCVRSIHFFILRIDRVELSSFQFFPIPSIYDFVSPLYLVPEIYLLRGPNSRLGTLHLHPSSIVDKHSNVLRHHATGGGSNTPGSIWSPAITEPPPGLVDLHHHSTRSSPVGSSGGYSTNGSTGGNCYASHHHHHQSHHHHPHHHHAAAHHHQNYGGYYSNMDYLAPPPTMSSHQTAVSNILCRNLRFIFLNCIFF